MKSLFRSEWQIWYKEAFLVNAPLFWGPGFCKHSLQLFLVTVIPKPFMSYCGYRWITWFPSGTQYRCSAKAEQPHLQFRWGAETTLFLIEAKKNCIDLSWIYVKLSNHILLSEPLMVVSWRISFMLSLINAQPLNMWADKHFSSTFGAGSSMS